MATHFENSQDIVEQIQHVAEPHHQIQVFDAGSTVPSLDMLHQFDAVLVDSCTSPFLCPTALGNVLAQYCDCGGNVVLCGMSNISTLVQQNVLGRFKQDMYHPLQYLAHYSFNRPCFLGKIECKHHPILHRVKSFFGGKYSAHALSSVTEQAQVIASWSDGYPLIAIKQNGKDGDAFVVALNMVAGSSNVVPSFWSSQTDGNYLLYNSLLFVAEQCRYRKCFKQNLYQQQQQQQTLSFGDIVVEL